MRCLDLYMWYPARKHAANHEATQPVLGVTNWDRCRGVYWLIGETDNNINIEYIKRECHMIVKTRKGYHFYTKYCFENPLRTIHFGLKFCKWLDKAHLRMGLKRYRKTGRKENAFLVLRVSPKYSEPDLKIVYTSVYMPEWHMQVKNLIEVLNNA